MYRDRIADQMCRDPDEERSYYGTAARCNMSIIIYNLPSGCRLWFNMLTSVRRKTRKLLILQGVTVYF